MSPAELPSLSVVLPTFNEAGWLEETLAKLADAIDRSPFCDVEVLVVDDGSTDATQSVLERVQLFERFQVVTCSNGGRLVARRKGLEVASGELVLFLDSRVHACPDALRFVASRIQDSPDDLIWNGHARTAPSWAPWTRFWDAIAFLAWRRYLRRPETTSYGESDFEYFPKGTTFFLAPRKWLITATDSVESLSNDPTLANDDTIMIRNLLHFGRINISPEFDCIYHPRATLKAFLKNAYHRGSVLVDGHLRPGLRFYRPFQAIVCATPGVAFWLIRRPKRLMAAPVVASVAAGVAAKSAGVPWRESLSFGSLVLPFSAAYGAGIIRGFRVRRRP